MKTGNLAKNTNICYGSNQGNHSNQKISGNNNYGNHVNVSNQSIYKNTVKLA
jgi:hypothetical protein